MRIHLERVLATIVVAGALYTVSSIAAITLRFLD